MPQAAKDRSSGNMHDEEDWEDEDPVGMGEGKQSPWENQLCAVSQGQRGGNTKSLDIGLSGQRVWGNLRTEEGPLDLLLGVRKAPVTFKRVV